MSRLVRKGYAIRPIQGIYAGIPLEHAGMDYQVNKYVLASKVASGKAVLSLHSALELHGVAQSYFNLITCLSQHPRRGFEFQGSDYRFITSKHWFGIQKTLVEGVELSVTDRERTLLDCIRRMDDCGGLEEVVKSLSGFHSVDTDVIGKYLKTFGEQSLIQRAGYVMSLLKEDLRIPDGFLQGLKISIGRKVYYLIPGMMRGSNRLDKDWNVMVPKNIEEVLRIA